MLSGKDIMWVLEFYLKTVLHKTGDIRALVEASPLSPLKGELIPFNRRRYADATDLSRWKVVVSQGYVLHESSSISIDTYPRI